MQSRIHHHQRTKKMATKILRKLTLKEVVGGKAKILEVAQLGRVESTDDSGKKVFASVGIAVPLCTIIGQVRNYKADSSDLGPYLKLMGTFEATNLQTGEIVPVNGTCILPNFIADAIGTALQAGAEAVDFAVQVNAKYDEAAASMYVFEAESLLSPVEAAPISALKAAMLSAGIALPKPANVPALPAPTPAPAPAPAASKSSRKR
jgi:hypothetical protein